MSVAAVNDLPPELTGGLTFHLPMEIVALQMAGASADVIAERSRQRLSEAFADGMIDPPLYRWAVRHYAPIATALLGDDVTARAAAFAQVVPLGDGLAGAAFHGLIRLGFGALTGQVDEVARGLAYLRTRRQVLASTGSLRDSALLVETSMPTVADLEGSTVFDQLNLVAGASSHLGFAPPQKELPTVASLCHGALALVRRNPSSFVSVHALTGVHALCEVHRMVEGVAPAPHDSLDAHAMAPWWRTYQWALHACTVLVMDTPPQAIPAAHAEIDSFEALQRAAVDTGETHDVKVVLAMRRLTEFGLLSLETVLEVGTLKIAAAECAA